MVVLFEDETDGVVGYEERETWLVRIVAVGHRDEADTV